MENILQFIQSNIVWAPYMILGLLLLAGLCLPVSEDAMLFISALLAANNPEYFYHFLICVFLGAYFSDLIAYWLGRILGPKIWNFKIVEKTVSKDKIKTMSGYFEKYGFITLIFGRFVPFGFRNAMFISAGLSKMNFSKFMLADLIACTISTAVYFPLYYFLGAPVIEYVKKGNFVIFGIFIAVVSVIYLVKRNKK